MTASAGRATTLVASSRPPRPTSRSSTSAGCSAKARKAAAVVISKWVMSSLAVGRLRARQHVDQLVLADRRAPCRRRRRARCARGSAPDAARCRRARACRRPRSMALRKAVTEPLPLVPATCITGGSSVLRDRRACRAAARRGRATGRSAADAASSSRRGAWSLVGMRPSSPYAQLARGGRARCDTPIRTARDGRDVAMARASVLLSLGAVARRWRIVVAACLIARLVARLPRSARSGPRVSASIVGPRARCRLDQLAVDGAAVEIAADR